MFKIHLKKQEHMHPSAENALAPGGVASHKFVILPVLVEMPVRCHGFGTYLCTKRMIKENSLVNMHIDIQNA